MWEIENGCGDVKCSSAKEKKLNFMIRASNFCFFIEFFTSKVGTYIFITSREKKNECKEFSDAQPNEIECQQWDNNKEQWRKTLEFPFRNIEKIIWLLFVLLRVKACRQRGRDHDVRHYCGSVRLVPRRVNKVQCFNKSKSVHSCFVGTLDIFFSFLSYHTNYASIDLIWFGDSFSLGILHRQNKIGGHNSFLTAANDQPNDNNQLYYHCHR